MDIFLTLPLLVTDMPIIEPIAVYVMLLAACPGVIDHSSYSVPVQ